MEGRHAVAVLDRDGGCLYGGFTNPTAVEIVVVEVWKHWHSHYRLGAHRQSLLLTYTRLLVTLDSESGAHMFLVRIARPLAQVLHQIF